MLDLNAGIGIPRTIGFELAVARLYPVQFGFGLGLMPIQGMVRRYMNFDPADYAQEVQGYKLTPSVSLSWTAFTGFVQYFFNPNFYVEGIYATWIIRGNASVSVSGGELKDSSITLGSLSFNLYQPMFGAVAGWRMWLGSSPYYFDFSAGLLKFMEPRADLSISTLADPYQGLLPAETQQQIEDAHQQINTEFDVFVNQYKAKVKYAPSLSITFGRWI